MYLIPTGVQNAEKLEVLMTKVGNEIVNKTGQDTGIRMWLPYERATKNDILASNAKWIRQYSGELIQRHELYL